MATYTIDVLSINKTTTWFYCSTNPTGVAITKNGKRISGTVLQLSSGGVDYGSLENIPSSMVSFTEDILFLELSQSGGHNALASMAIYKDGVLIRTITNFSALTNGQKQYIYIGEGDFSKNLNSLSIGDFVPCNYQVAASGSVGVFSNILTSKSDSILNTSTATPNGTFFFVYVGSDYKGRKILVADRNVQHTVSWDTLNRNGITSSTGTMNDHAVMCKDLTDSLATSAFSASSSYSTSFAASRAFDNVYNESNAGWQTAGGNISNQWVQVDFGSSTYIDYIRWQNDSSSSYYGTAIRNYRIESSHDNVNWTTQHTGIGKLGLGEYTIATFTPSDSFRYWRIYIVDNHGHASYIFLSECEMKDTRNAIFNSDFNFTLRTLSGGIFSSDVVNEWDRYVCNSTLGDNITAGDVSVWNWSLPSWTSSSSTTNTSRVVRGGAAVTTYAQVVSSTSTNGNGFRPVLVVENLTTYVATVKYFITEGSDVKYYDPTTSSWLSAGTTPITETMLGQYGMDSLSFLNASAIAQLGSNFTVVSYVPDQDALTRTLGYSAIPNGKLITQSQDIAIYGDLQSFAIDSTLSGNGVVRILASADMGNTWKTWDAGNNSWSTVTTTNLTSVKNLGMTPSTFNAITAAQWSSLITGDAVRFAYYLELTSTSDSALINSLSMTDRVYTASPTIGLIAVNYQGIDPTYYGLLFGDSVVNSPFQKADGTILRVPNFGTIVAGNTSNIQTFNIANAYNFSVKNLVVEPFNVPTGVTVLLSKNTNPFSDSASLTFASTIVPDEFVTFYAKVQVDPSASPLSGANVQFRVRAEPA